MAGRHARCLENARQRGRPAVLDAAYSSVGFRAFHLGERAQFELPRNGAGNRRPVHRLEAELAWLEENSPGEYQRIASKLSKRNRDS